MSSNNKKQRHKLANRFKDAKDAFKLVNVRDPAAAGLTGFDAPWGTAEG